MAIEEEVLIAGAGPVGLVAAADRVQSEQFKLTRILLAKLVDRPGFAIEFGKRVDGVTQEASCVTVRVSGNNGDEERRARWLIGADGARSEVRRALGIDFEGFTWPERFLVVSTPFDFSSVVENLVSVSYVCDPERWHFLLQIPDFWRVMFPIAPAVSDETAVSRDLAQ